MCKCRNKIAYWTQKLEYSQGQLDYWKTEHKKHKPRYCCLMCGKEWIYKKPWEDHLRGCAGKIINDSEGDV